MNSKEVKQATEIANWSLFSKNEPRFSVWFSHLQTWSLMSYSALCRHEEFYWTEEQGAGEISVAKGFLGGGGKGG